MDIEYIIIIFALIISILLIILVPKNKRRVGLVAFLALQAVTWTASLFVVYFNVIDFPVRLFNKATKISVIFEFFFYPSLFIWFYLKYSNSKSKLIKGIYYIAFVSIISWFIFLTGKYTNLHKPTEVSGYKEIIRLYISFFIEFFIALSYTKWFFKNGMPREDVIKQ